VIRRLANKTALVTGASSGIGEAIARTLASEGASVALTYHKNRDKAEMLAGEFSKEGFPAIAVQLDLADRSQIRTTAQKVISHFGGRLDVLVNNAGEWMNPTPLVECSDAVWERMIAIDLSSLFYMCREVAPVMMRQKSGAIVNISSVVARTGGGGGTIPYAAAKGGVNALTYGLARELAGHGIRVNGVAPGLVDTPILKNADPERLRKYIDGIPLKRMAKPEEIAGAVLLLASDTASYITGEVIDVNGGLLMD